MTVAATMKLDLKPGREVALLHAALKLERFGMGREGEPGHEVVLRVQGEEEDREDGVDRDDRERAEDDVRPHHLGAVRPHRSSLRSPTRSTIAARMKITIARIVAIAAAYPTRLKRNAFWYMYIEGTIVVFPGPPAVVL